MNNDRRSRLPWAVALWLTLTLIGFMAFHAYGRIPGTTGLTPLLLPDETVGQRKNCCFRLILFVHPRCPCTRATLVELAILLELNRYAVAAEVRFVRPEGMPEGWEQSSLWQAAAAIPGLGVYCDNEGVLARRLGAETSGHVVLYDPYGKLLFSGGITCARGQDGESAGRRAILALLAGKAAPPQLPVFGCPLFAPGECCRKELDACRP